MSREEGQHMYTNESLCDGAPELNNQPKPTFLSLNKPRDREQQFLLFKKIYQIVAEKQYASSFSSQITKHMLNWTY